MKPLLVLLVTMMLVATSCAPAQPLPVSVPEPAYWPTAGWQTSTPEAQGMDSKRLADMLEKISSDETSIHSVLVMRNGYLVTETYFTPYTRDTNIHVQSVTKSVIGMLVGKAIGEGLLESEQQKLLDFYPDQTFANPDEEKDAIELKHLLSMSSGLECAEFSATGPRMEETQDWVQFMLDRPMAAMPGEQFGYCNGNAHLLSSVLAMATVMSTREYANQELFRPLGIPTVSESDWGSDPQGITLGGYGLHLKPADLAKLGLLYLHKGKWNGQQLIPAAWVEASTTEYIQKDDGNGYGYLWTIYPDDGHYAALGLGGQQIHVYPSRNLVVVVTAALEAYAGAPEIETLLSNYILPAIQSDEPLPENPEGYAGLQAQTETATHPVQPVPPLPATAREISGSLYTFEENPLGWQSLQFDFEEGASTARLALQGLEPLTIGLDNVYRSSRGEAIGELLLRGRWTDEQTFVVDYPYPAFGAPVLGELGETQFLFKFSEDTLEITVEELVFGREPVLITGTR